MEVKHNIATSVMTSFIIGSTSMLGASATVPIAKSNKYVDSRVFNQNNTQTKTLINSNFLETSDSTEQSLSSFSKKGNNSQDFILIKNELLSYGKLEQNWDFASGLVPEKIVIDTSIKFLKQLETLDFPLPTPMLSSDGEICLYWKKENYYIEIGFEEEGYFSYAIDDYDKPFGEDNLSVDSFYKTRLYAALSNSSFNI